MNDLVSAEIVEQKDLDLLSPSLGISVVPGTIFLLANRNQNIMELQTELDEISAKWGKAKISTESIYKEAGQAVIEIDNKIKEIENTQIAHGKPVNYYKKQLFLIHRQVSATSKALTEKYVTLKQDLKANASTWYLADKKKKEALQERLNAAEDARVEKKRLDLLARSKKWEDSGNLAKAQQLEDKASQLVAAPVVIPENEKSIDGSGLTAKIKNKVVSAEKMDVLKLILNGVLCISCIDLNLTEIEGEINRRDLTEDQLPGIRFEEKADMSINRK